MNVTLLAAAILVAVGLAGIVVPVLPGTLLVAGGVLLWAFAVDSATGWVVLAVAVALLAAGAVVKYTLPGRRLKAAGVPSSTLWVGGGLAVVGFFVIPLVGLFVGFVAGVYLAERRRLGASQAWPSTVHALKAAGLSVLVELVAGLLATAAWIVGVVLV